MSLYASGTDCSDGIVEYDFFYEPSTYHYFAASFDADSYETMRDRFLGSYRTESNPLTVETGSCSGSAELGGNHCGALHKRLTLAPGEETRVLFMLGVGPRAKGREIRGKYADHAEVDRAFDELKQYWAQKCSTFQCSTPHAEL